MNQIAEIGPDEREFAPPDADDFRAEQARAFDLVGLRDAVKPRERGPVPAMACNRLRRLEKKQSIISLKLVDERIFVPIMGSIFSK